VADCESDAEEWRTVPGHPQYEVSSLGRVRSYRKSGDAGIANILRTGLDRSGYLRTTLDGKLYRVHQVVALAWHGLCPEGMEVGHLNHKPDDNRPENLAYVTRQENMAEMRRPPRTHCKRGHPLSGDNLYVQPSNGARICRICRRRSMTKRHHDDCDYCGRPLPDGSTIQGDKTIRAGDQPVRSEFSKKELRAEEWRTVAADPDYEVSNLGRIRSFKGRRSTDRVPFLPRMLKPWRDYAGYESLKVGGRRQGVHQLVADAFIEPRPDGYEVAHINHIRNDNRVENLRYVTRQENLSERYKEQSTHCTRGHPLSGDNLYIVPHNGRRVCRICLRPRLRKRSLHDCPRCGQPLPEQLKSVLIRDEESPPR
jgi:Zn finger protein HypA/HybF involved in hydrogenase expression